MKVVEQTLMDQMGISEREIARRLHLLNYTNEDQERIKKIAPHFRNTAPRLVDVFYEQQLADSEVSQIIGDVDTLSRLKQYMQVYIKTLVSAVYDEDYVNSRLRVGKVHKRLDVRPKLYMQAHEALQDLLDREIDEMCASDDAVLVKRALHKIMLFDAELVFDAYVEAYLTEMQSATWEVDKYASHVGIKIDTMFTRLHDRVQKDSLTGLYNRHVILEILRNECRVAERHQLSFVLVYIDLNRFKAVNDLHGHHAGDDVLKQVADSIHSVIRSVDIPVRYGGDEFCIIMPRTSAEKVDGILKRLLSDFDKRCEYPVTLSIGILQVGPFQFDKPERLIQKADTLMYDAKSRARKDGKHHWQYENRREETGLNLEKPQGLTLKLDR